MFSPYITNGDIRSCLYNYIIPNTKYMYEKVLTDKIVDGSRILEVGIGNGNCLSYNKALIKRKNLQIVGIDIDEEYIDSCRKNIDAAGLSSNVSCRIQDLLKMKPSRDKTRRYDVILFMESYPVIPISVMEKMVEKSRSLLHEHGKLIFVHNLVDFKNPLMNFIKPLIVEFTTVDFGRLTSHSEMKQFIERTNLKKYHIEKIYDAYLSEVFPFVPSFLDHRMEQFAISCKFAR